MAGPFSQGVRRCPTLPHSLPCSTIGAEGLNFRVRDGTGCFPLAKTTERSTHNHPGVAGKLSVPSQAQNSIISIFAVPALLFGNHTGTRCFSAAVSIGLNVVCVQATRPISTGRLHTLPCFHLRPINPIVCWGPYTPQGGGRTHLEEGFPLRCFQRLSLPNVANQPCPWRDNWHTRGSSVPVLSY